MNPFQKLPPLPAGACGARGFGSAAEAKAAAQGQAQGGFVVLQAPARVSLGAFSLQIGDEFAWVAPLETWTARAELAIAGGIKVVEIVKP